MKSEDFFDILGDVDEEKVAHAGRAAKKTRAVWIRFGAMAACVCLLMVAVLGFGFSEDGWFVANTTATTTTTEQATTTTTAAKTEQGLATSTKRQDEVASTTTSILQNTTQMTQAPTTGPVDDSSTTKQAFTTTAHEHWYEPKWEHRSMPGKFHVFLHNNGEYVYPFNWVEDASTNRTARKILSAVTLVGIDEYDAEHTTVVDIFAIEGFDEALALGVKFEGIDRIYLYLNTHYTPQTLGEFLADSDFENTVTFGGIALFKGGNNPVNAQNVADMHTYLFADKTVKNEFSKDVYDYCVTLTINLEELCCRKKAFYLYESGYIATNLLGDKYVFFVGEKAVADFLENSYHVTFEQLKEINKPASTTPQGGADATVTPGATVTSSAHFPR